MSATMQFVACPHCRHQMEDDGSLSGQPVQCPACSGRFQMPGPAPFADPFANFTPPSKATRPLKARAEYRYNAFHFIMAGSAAAVAVGSTVGFLWWSWFGMFGPWHSELRPSWENAVVRPWDVGVLAALAASFSVTVYMAATNRKL